MQLEPADVLGRSRFGGLLEKRSEPFAAPDMTPLRPRTELAPVHVLDHALTQRVDGIRTHGKLLSWMRLKTPRSSRQGVSPATDDLSPRDSARDRARRSAGYRASDLVHWPRAAGFGIWRNSAATCGTPVVVPRAREAAPATAP